MPLIEIDENWTLNTDKIAEALFYPNGERSRCPRLDLHYVGGDFRKFVGDQAARIWERIRSHCSPSRAAVAGVVAGLEEYGRAIGELRRAAQQVDEWRGRFERRVAEIEEILAEDDREDQVEAIRAPGDPLVARPREAAQPGEGTRDAVDEAVETMALAVDPGLRHDRFLLNQAMLRLREFLQSYGSRPDVWATRDVAVRLKQDGRDAIVERVYPEEFHPGVPGPRIVGLRFPDGGYGTYRLDEIEPAPSAGVPPDRLLFARARVLAERIAMMMEDKADHEDPEARAVRERYHELRKKMPGRDAWRQANAEWTAAQLVEFVRVELAGAARVEAPKVVPARRGACEAEQATGPVS